MVTIDQIIYVLPILGLTVSLFYYAMVLRNQNKTRRIQLLTQLSSRYRTIDGSAKYFELLNAEWSTYDDFEKKYGSDNNLEFTANRYVSWGTYNDIGYWVKKRFIDLEDVYNLFGTGPVWVWEKYEPIIVEQRKRYNGADWHFYFEYLAQELLKMKIRKDPLYKIPENLAKYISETTNP